MGIQEFIGKLASDKELLAKAKNVKGVDDLIALGQEAGHDISKEDLDSVVSGLTKGAGKLLNSQAPEDGEAKASGGGIDMSTVTGLLGNILKK